MFEHGDSIVSASKQVLLYAGRGPWNDEALLRSHQTTLDEISQFPNQDNWAQLSCLFGECLMPPSAFDIFVDYCRLRKRKGLKCTAIAIQDSEIVSTIKQQLLQAYQITNIEYEFFESVAQAQEWLGAKGFFIDTTQLNKFLKGCSFAPSNYL